MSALVPFEQVLPSGQSWGVMKMQANELIKSNFLPASIKTPEQAMMIILKGRELGIPPIQALSQIAVIQGKPTMSAELMLSQIMRLHPRTKISFSERSNEVCTIKVQRYGCEPSVFSYTIGDAEKAGLLLKDSWRKYPRAMLHARAVSEMARSLFADAISGVSYTPEEMGKEVNDEGEVIEVESETVSVATNNHKPALEETITVKTDAPPSPPTVVFSKRDPTHCRQVMKFLEGKNQMSQFDTLMDRIEGKPYSQKTLQTEWPAIDPEAPDAEPEVTE
jgi:hypothetical protein